MSGALSADQHVAWLRENAEVYIKDGEFHRELIWAANEIERLHGLLGRVLASGRLTGHALADEIRAVDMGPR